MDLRGWLRSLGLERYEAAFRDNAIDEKVLPRLTAEDLKDLGVGLVGHRRMAIGSMSIRHCAATRTTPAQPQIKCDRSLNPKEAAPARLVLLRPFAASCSDPTPSRATPLRS
jgi:SAM domain (Sterile alpha motif)